LSSGSKQSLSVLGNEAALGHRQYSCGYERAALGSVFDVLSREKKARNAFTTLCFSVLFFLCLFLTLRGLSAYFGTLALYTLTLPGCYITRANRPTGNGMERIGNRNEFYLLIRTSGCVFGFDVVIWGSDDTFESNIDGVVYDDCV
jgi:hypothetical protein